MHDAHKKLDIVPIKKKKTDFLFWWASSRIHFVLSEFPKTGIGIATGRIPW